MSTEGDTFIALLISSPWWDWGSITKGSYFPAVMSKWGSLKEPEELGQLFIGRLSYETTNESGEVFEKLRNTHELHGIKHEVYSKRNTKLSRAFGFVTYKTVEEVNITINEFKAIQGVWKSQGTQENCVKTRFSKSTCSVNCKKGLSLWFKKDTKKHQTSPMRLFWIWEKWSNCYHDWYRQWDKPWLHG